MKLKAIRFPSSAVPQTKNIKDVVVVFFYGFEKEKKRRSKLPLLCVFGRVDQPVADEHDAGLQYKEINPLHSRSSRVSSLSLSHFLYTSGAGASSQFGL